MRYVSFCMQRLICVADKSLDVELTLDTHDVRPGEHPSDHLIDAPGEAGWRVLFSGANRARTLVLSGGVALLATNIYLATTILPSVVRDIGGLDLYAWNTTIFVVASIVASALATRLLQVMGPRGAYTVSAGIFAVGAVVCAVSPAMHIMLVGRLIQGVGAGFLFALTYAVIRLLFTEALWPRAMALVSGIFGIATLIGPAAGGIYAEIGAWRAAFWSLALMTVMFVVLAIYVLPKSHVRAGKYIPVPVTQVLVSMACIASISAGSITTDIKENLEWLALSGFLFAALIFMETRACHKLLPTGSFRPKGYLFSLYATISLFSIIVTSAEIFTPLFLQELHQQPPLRAGYMTAVVGAGWTIGSLLSAGFGARAVHRVLVNAPVLSLMGIVALAILMPASRESASWTLMPICSALVCIGLSVGLAWPHLLTLVLKVAPADEQEIAGTSITTVQLFATAIGAAIAGTVANAAGLADPGGTEGISRAARWVFGLFAFAPLLSLATAGRAAKALGATPSAV